MTDLTPPQDPQGPQEPQAPQQPESPQPNMFIGPTMFERQPMTNAYARPTFANDPAWAAKVQLEKDQNDTQVMMRIRQAIKDGDHDAVAEADRLQLKTGLSMRSIRENAGDARSIAAALDARDAGYAESNPALFRSINDPKFAAIAADDLDNLSWYERLGKGIDRGQLMVEQGNLGWKLMRDKKLSDADTARLDEITEEMDAFSIDEGWVALTGETLGLMGDTMPTALGAGALAGTAVGLIPGGQPFAMPAFMLASGGVGYSQMAAIEGGLAFIQYRKGGMDLETATTNATIVGRLNGMIELLPLGVVGKPFVSAGKAVARSSVRAVSRDGLSGAVRRMMAKRTSRRSIGKTAQRWALGTASEVTAEVGQELVTAFHEKLGMAETGVLRKAQVGKVAGDFHMPGGGTIRTHEDGTVSVTPAIFDYVNNIIPIGSAGHAGDDEMHKLKPAEAEQLINELDRLYPLESVLNDETLMDDVIGLMGDTAWSALKGMWVIGGGGPMLQHMSERAQVKQSKLDHETLAETVGKAKASKTNKRAPSMFARFWQAQAEEGDDAVLVSRKDLNEKMTEAGIGIDELDKIFPGVKDQYELDADVQPDIVIPKGEAVSKFENNELFDMFKDVLRPNRDALSSRQLGALEKEVAAKSEDLRKQLDEDGAVVDARDLELDAIEEQIKQQLITAGTKPREASVQAAWARTVVGLRALRKSKTEGRAVMPSEISRPETISAQEDERRRSEQAENPDNLQQVDTQTPEFKQFFDGSKVVDEAGAPLVVYHGAPDARFAGEGGDGVFQTAQERFGMTDEDRSFFFTTSRAIADTYADDSRAFDYQNADPGVVDVYLSIKNPMVIDAAGKEWREAQRRGKTSDVMAEAKASGHDGVIIRNVRDAYNNNSRTPASDVHVAFDPTQIKSVNNRGTFDRSDSNILNAKEGAVVRGQFDPLSMTIILGKDHNATTFFHEWSHFHLQTLMNDFATGQASAEDIADLNAIAKWSGHTDAATLAKASPATIRAAHEAWAASFERYLYTNSADSAEMRTTMQRIAEFFVEAWRQIKRIDQNYKRIYGQHLPALNAEVRGVMDRMMLSDDQINTRLQQDAVAKMLDGVEVSDEEQVILDSLYFDHESKSKEEMRRHFVKQLRRLRSFRSRELAKLQKDSRKARTAAEEQAREDLLREKPEARLVHWLDTGEIIEFNAAGDMVVHEALAEPARIATTDPRVPKKYRALSPELAEDMQVDAEIELLEAQEVRDEQQLITDKRLEDLKASMASDRELRKAVKKEQTIVRKTQNSELIAANDEVIENADVRIANALESIQNAKAEQADWNRLVKQEEANVNKAKATTMKATDPARVLDDGVDITFLVLKFGLDSGEQLIEGVQFNLTEEMHQAADKIMGEESSELSSPEAIQATVSEAVNNEALLRVRSAELAIIDKQSPGQNVLLATAKAVAKRVVSALLVKQLATHDSDQPPQMGQRRRMATGLGRRFEAAAKNAERQARSARDAKNLAEMRAHQRTALQQRALAAEAYAQRDNLRKTTARLNSVLRWTGAKREGQLGRAYGGETVETARMMLGLIGIGKGSRLDTDGKYDPVADSPVSDSQKAELTAALNEAKEVSRLVRGDYKNMAIGDLREFLQGVDGILNLGRRMRLVKKGDMTIVIEELAEELNLQADREGRAAPDDRQDTTGLLRSKLGGLNDKWQRMESLLYQMDGGKIGTLTKTIWQPIAEAVERLNEEEGNVLAEFKDLIRPLRDQVRGNRKLGEPITASVLVSQRDGKPFVFEQGKLGIIGAMLHAGSMSNLVRLLGGWKWAIEDEETGEMDVSIWHKQVQEWEDNGTITEADWKMVRSIWALYDKMLPAMKQAHFEATGHDMELTQRMDVVTKWGKIEGGYVPAARDPMKQKTRSVVREGNSILDAQREMPFVQRGMVKGRVKHNYEALDLDPLRQVEHFHKHLIFTHLAVPAQQLNATVYHDDVAGAIERLYPGFYQNHMKPWMETVTTQSSTLGQHQNIDGAASFWTALRRNTGSVAMMGNIRNALQNIGGVALAAARVKPRFLMLAAYDYMSQPFAVRDEINAKSRMMRLRHAAGNNIYEVRDAINELTESSNLLIRNAEATRKFLAKHTYILQELTQKPLDRIVWLGAYKQAVDKGAKEKDAIREADSAVRTTQHDSTPISLASGEKGGPVQKMFSQFMGWFVMLSSLRGGDFHNMSKGNAMMLVMGPMITTLVIGEIVSEMLDDQEPEDEGWDKSAVRIAANSLFALPRAFGPIGSGVSTGLQTFIGSALGTAEGYQMRMPEPAGIALIGRAFREGRQWIESLQTGKDMGNTSVDFSEMLLGALGYPLGAVTNRIQAGVTDEDADLKGLIVGR